MCYSKQNSAAESGTVDFFLPSVCGPTPLLLKPRNVSGPPRKKQSFNMISLLGCKGLTTPAARDNCATCQSTKLPFPHVNF